MKCVAEIMMIRAKAEAEYQAEQKRLDQIAHEQHTERIAKTIEFCETTINDFFVKSAQNRVEFPQFELKCEIQKDRIGNEMIIPMVKTKLSNYADGRTEHESSNEKFDLVALAEYLEQFCYSIKTEEDFYWQYGWGQRPANKIVISLT